MGIPEDVWIDWDVVVRLLGLKSGLRDTEERRRVAGKSLISPLVGQAQR